MSLRFWLPLFFVAALVSLSPAKAQDASVQAIAEEATGLYRAAMQTRDPNERGRLLFLVSQRLQTVRADFPRSTVASQVRLGRYREIDVSLAEREGKTWGEANPAMAASLSGGGSSPLVPSFGTPAGGGGGPLVPSFGGGSGPQQASLAPPSGEPSGTAKRLPRSAIVEKLRANTVMLYAKGESAGTYGWGTGFFIAPNLIQTNTHVVLNHEQMVVIGKEFGFRIGKVIYRGANDNLVGLDTAVIEVQNYRSPSFLEFTDKLSEGDQIAIAGFTGTSMEVDGNAERMFKILGDDKIPPREIIPALRFDFGVIQGIYPNAESQVENLQTGLTSGGGNSGSPIVNECGQVVGQHYSGNKARFDVSKTSSGKIVATGESTRFSFALSSRELIRFLNQNRVPATVSKASCG